MGLACSQVQFLTLTARKADCEYGISIDTIQKMQLTREQTQLSQEYYSRLQDKQISYYANGQYNKMNYSYLMGSNYVSMLEGSTPLKNDNSMILTDYNGRVVLNSTYANAITSVLGTSVDSNGRGGTFSSDKIPEILAKIITGQSADTIEQVINNESLGSSYTAAPINTSTGESTGTTEVVDNSTQYTDDLVSLVEFYYPIFSAAAANGWTTEYNDSISTNDDYISDALVNGTLQLATVNDDGNYDTGTSLTYYVTAGNVWSNTSSDAREEVTAWYEAEKQSIAEKESYIDLDMEALSTELEAINTELQSLQSFIDDAIDSVFDWGSG